MILSVKTTVTIVLLVIMALLMVALAFLMYRNICRRYYRRLLVRPAPMPKVDRSPTSIDQSTVYGRGKNWFYTHRMEFLNVNIEAFDKVKLHGYFRPSADRRTRNVVILLHGYNEHPSEMAAYARLLMTQLECHVLIPHSRAHCMSGGRICTYGLYESVDLESWISFAKRQAGDNCRIFIFGRSMGASVALLAAQQKEFSPNVAGIIADCPYESLEKISLDIFRRHYNFSGQIFYNHVRREAQKRHGFDIDYCDAAVYADKIRVPVLIFQGGDDTLTTPDGAKRIYENLKCDKKMIVIDHAEHLMCYNHAPALYERETRKFIEECVVRLVKIGKM